MRTKGNTSKKQKKNAGDEFGDTKVQFLMAAVSLVESSLILIFMTNNYLIQTVPLLWIVNLFYFYDGEHPLVLKFVSDWASRIKEFLFRGERVN